MKSRDEKSLLIIFDDILPQNLSSFRNVESSAYLKKFDDIVYVNISLNPIKKELVLNEVIDNNIKYFQTNLNDDEFTRLNSFLSLYKRKVAMITFLNNIYGLNGKVLDFLEKQNIRFSFTLYPGGGFFLNEETSKKLKRIFESPMFYKVIVNQKQSLLYLKNNNFCSSKSIEFIYGLPIATYMLMVNNNKRKFKNNVFNVCFVAYKYSEKGKDKGYDTFIKVAEMLKNDDSYMFHVVGNFDSNDIDISDIKDRINFYGILENKKFIDFYKDKQVLITPTRANILYKGAFDGFPTGASVDAMLNQVVLLTTDPLYNNSYFNDDEDIIIINNDVNEIVNKVVSLKNDYKRCVSISKNGKNKAKKLYSYNKQILPRIKIIKEMMNYE